jgi:hypothetical protein
MVPIYSLDDADIGRCRTVVQLDADSTARRFTRSTDAEEPRPYYIQECTRGSVADPDIAIGLNVDPLGIGDIVVNVEC